MNQFGLYVSGTKVTEKPEILFQRLDLKEVLEKVEAKKAETAKPEEPVIDIEAKEEITFEDFEKMQFQVGEIISCEAVKKSKKLLCSQVKIGSEVKQIVSGIKEMCIRDRKKNMQIMLANFFIGIFFFLKFFYDPFQQWQNHFPLGR